MTWRMNWGSSLRGMLANRSDALGGTSSRVEIRTRALPSLACSGQSRDANEFLSWATRDRMKIILEIIQSRSLIWV